MLIRCDANFERNAIPTGIFPTSGEYEKLFEAYLEYADLCLMNSNIPQAIRLLFEVEAIARVRIFTD